MAKLKGGSTVNGEEIATKKDVDNKQTYHVGDSPPTDKKLIWIDTSE